MCIHEGSARSEGLKAVDGELGHLSGVPSSHMLALVSGEVPLDVKS